MESMLGVFHGYLRAARVAYLTDQEQSLPPPPTTTRPFTAMGDVQRITPWHAPALAMAAPVSPSRPARFAPFMYQTMASDFPSVVVATGETTVPVCAAHQATAGLISPPTTGTEIAMIPLPPPPAGQLAPWSVLMIT